MTGLRKHAGWMFILAVSLAGIFIAWLATSRYGGGLPTDAMRYIAFADNLLKGRGLIDYDQGRLLVFPPLFPWLIAALASLTRADVFLVGWYLNLFLWGVNLFLSGLFLRQVFAQRPLYAWLALLVVCLSPSALAMHTSLLTEPLFLTFSLLLFFAGREYLETRSRRAFWGMILLGIGASLLRWAGMSHIVVAGLVVLWAWRTNLKAGLLRAAGLGLLSFAPVGGWIYFHNYLPTGTLWGISSKGNVFVLENILQALRKIFYWFVPYRPISPDGKWDALVVFSVLLLVLLLVNRKQHWQQWGREYTHPLVLVSTSFAVVKFAATALMAQTADHRALASDRYYALLLVPILVILFLTFHHLIRPHLRLSERWGNVALLLVFSIWLLLPVNRLTKYLRLSLRDGEAGYNLYNVRKYHESELIQQTRALLEREPDAVLYSNIPAPVWFFTRHLMTYLIPKRAEWTWDDFKHNMAGWPYDKPGYLLWFEDDPFKIFYTPGDLYRIAEIQPVYRAADGVIYSVSPRKQP
ncbi:MAG: hypothetical protein N2117_11695 [Anaerolineales bacterium]|nr:hypothetical protein [Anaerolineales bacterium]